jgi:prefoldin subunit 5
MLSLYNRSPFHLINNTSQIPFGGDVYVISDAKYAELRSKQAADEIAVLQKRLDAYTKAVDQLKETINELQIEHNLLPEATEE